MARGGKWSLSIATITLGVVASIVLYHSDLSAGNNHFHPKCTLATFAGLYCPGCGNTRATQALLHGDVPRAIEQNVLFVFALPFLLVGAARVWLRWMFPERVPSSLGKWRWSYSLILVGIVVLFGILRNLPVEPFNWLAPVAISRPVPLAAP